MAGAVRAQEELRRFSHTGRGWYGLSEVNRDKKGIHVGLDGSSPGRLLTYRRIDQISMYFTDNGSQQLSL